MKAGSASIHSDPEDEVLKLPVTCSQNLCTPALPSLYSQSIKAISDDHHPIVSGDMAVDLSEISSALASVDPNEDDTNSNQGAREPFSTRVRVVDALGDIGPTLLLGSGRNMRRTTLFEMVALIGQIEVLTTRITGSKVSHLTKSVLTRITPTIRQELRDSRFGLEQTRSTRNSAYYPTRQETLPRRVNLQQSAIKDIGGKLAISATSKNADAISERALRAIIPADDDAVIGSVQAVCTAQYVLSSMEQSLVRSLEEVNMWISISTPKPDGTVIKSPNKALVLLGLDSAPTKLESPFDPVPPPAQAELKKKQVVVELALERLQIVDKQLKTVNKELVQHIWGNCDRTARKSLLAAILEVVKFADGHASA